MSRTYAQHQQDLMPGALRGDAGLAWARAQGTLKDDLVARTRQSVYLGGIVDPEGRGREAPDEALVDRATAELRKVGLSRSEAITAGHVIRVPRSYPVYARGYRETLRPVVDFLRGFDNLWPIGRYGAFKYNNQDHSMLMGLLAAENIMLGSGHDLWDVNSDTESYQEETEA